MIDVALQWIDQLTPDRTELTVHVVDASGHVVPDASVRVLEDGDLHRVNTVTGDWTATEVWPTASELPFREGQTLHLVVAGPRHRAREVAWTCDGGRRDTLEVALDTIPFADFEGGPAFEYSRDNLARVLAPATAPMPLLSSFGRTLAANVVKLADVLDWTDHALDETAATYSGAEYVARAWRLHGIRAVAANRELARLRLDPSEAPGRDPGLATAESERQAQRLARTWAEYALASGTDARLAIDLCASARANPAACPIAD